VDSGEPKKPSIRWGPRSPREQAIWGHLQANLSIVDILKPYSEGGSSKTALGQCQDYSNLFLITNTNILHTHTPFNGPFLGLPSQVSWHQKGKTNLDFTEARDSEWQWHQLGHMQICTLLQTDNHASTPPLSFLQAGCPSCCPTNSVKALKALIYY